MDKKPPYICAMGIPQSFSEPCPRCGADEETEEGCLGFWEKLDTDDEPRDIGGKP